MWHIIKNAKEIASLSALVKGWHGTTIELQTTFGVIDVEWFASHHMHELWAVDEYNRLDGQCHKWAKCHECEHQSNCVLDDGHDGECKAKR